MKLQSRHWYVKLSSGINMTRNINGLTPVCTLCNNMRLVHERSVRSIEMYLVSKSTYVYLPDGHRWLSTCRVVYKPDKEKCIECHVDADFTSGWFQ